MKRSYTIPTWLRPFALFCLMPASLCFGQSVVGETVRSVGQSETYKLFTSNTGTSTLVCTITPQLNNVVNYVSRTPMGIYADITWNSAGTFSVSITAVGGDSGSTQVTVYPAHPFVTPATGCYSGGVTISATASGTGGNQVRWYTTDTGGSPFFIPNGNSGSVTVHSTTNTTYYVSSYHSDLGLESLTRTPVTATIVPEPSAAPAVSGNVVIGPGMPITLHASTTPDQAYTYKWYNPSGTLLYTGQNYTTTAPASTTVNFVYAKYNNVGCDGPGNGVTVTVYPKPVITGTAIAQGRPATITASTGYDTYAWYKQGGSGAIPGANAITYSTAESGLYLVRVTKGGATGDSDWFYLTSQFGHQNENQIVVNAIQVSEVTTPSAVEGLSNLENVQSVQYFDGLGRPKQMVATQASPLGKDIVQPLVYDANGREYRKYLPVVPGSTDGWYKAGIVDGSGNYSGVAAVNVYNNGAGDKVEDDPKPYAETLFEPSPLNRPFKQGAAGDTWQPATGDTYATVASSDHAIKKAYEFNIADEVMFLKYNMQTRGVGLGTTDYYAANELRANKSKDEHNYEVIEYIDREGHTILKKTETLVGGLKAYAETYYVYDDFGRLVMVVPPEASGRIKELLISGN